METVNVPESVLGPRDVVVVEGPDAVRYVHSQVSQDVAAMAVGETRWTFVLDPTGKVEVLARVQRTGEARLELDTDAGFGDALKARLDRFKIRVKAETSLHARAIEGARDEAARVAFGWPAMGLEIVPGDTLVAGTGLSKVAVSFTKGCYPGQELVERMDSRGATPPRALRRVRVADGAAAGDPVTDPDGTKVGVLTTVAGGHALAWVTRGHDVGEPIAF